MKTKLYISLNLWLIDCETHGDIISSDSNFSDAYK